MAVVKLKDVTKVFDNEIYAVRDFSVDISDGEFVVLVGPSGCGKSTVLRMIAGLEDITSGDIYIEDKLMNYVAPKDRDIAMVFQNYALYPHMNVYDNISFGLKLRKVKPSEIKQRVEKAADILGISSLMHRKPKALSGGQRQRVALGRSIVRQPKVFLFDEPLSNLDAKLRVGMRTEISKLHNRLKTTMIYVTHDQVEAMTLGDRIIIMNDGVIQQYGTPVNLYDNPVNKFVAGFIGSPSMNFISGKVEKNQGLVFKSGRLSFQIDGGDEDKLKDYVGREIIFGIRPEDISISGEEKGTPMSVDILEMMGNEIYLYLNIEQNTMIARVPPDTKVKEGEKINVSFDYSKAHYFDPDSEKSI